MSKLLEFRGKQSEPVGYMYLCPGCKNYHAVQTVKEHGNTEQIWEFSGTKLAPTFTPSVLYTEGDLVCHAIVTRGIIHFCGDCTHELAGKSVSMLDIA